MPSSSANLVLFLAVILGSALLIWRARRVPAQRRVRRFERSLEFWSRWFAVTLLDSASTFLLALVLFVSPAVLALYAANTPTAIFGLIFLATIPLCAVIFIQSFIIERRIQNARRWALIGMIGAILDGLLGIGWLTSGYALLTSVIGVALGGAALGALVGAVAVLLLRRVMEASQGWTLLVAGLAIGAAALGGTYGAVLSSGIQGEVAEVLVATLLGGMVGAAQWWVLRGQVGLAALWIPASASGWCLGALVKVLFFGATSGVAIVVAIVVGRIVIGLVGGLMLNWLLRQT